MYVTSDIRSCDFCLANMATADSLVFPFQIGHIDVCSACARLAKLQNDPPTMDGQPITFSSLWPQVDEAVQDIYLETFAGMSTLIEGQARQDGYAIAKWIAENTDYALAFAVGLARSIVGLICYSRTESICVNPEIYAGMAFTVPPINTLPPVGRRGSWISYQARIGARWDIREFVVLDSHTEPEALTLSEALARASNCITWPITRLY